MQVLVITEDKAQCVHLWQLLSQTQPQPFEITCEYTLAAGIKALEVNFFAVILLDMELSKPAGLEAFTQLRHKFPHVPIVLIAKDDNEPQALEAMRIGAQDYLLKAEMTTIALLTRTLRYAIERHHVQLAQHMSEARYRAVVEDQVDMICRYTPNFVLTFVNQAYADQYGKTPSELIGMNLFNMIPLEDHPGALAHICALNAEHPVAQTEHRTILTDGTIRLTQWTDRAIFDSTGRIVEYQGVGRDVTHLDQMRRFQQATLDSIRSQIAVLERDGTIAHVNSAWRRFAEENPPPIGDAVLGNNYLSLCEHASAEDAPTMKLIAAGTRDVINGQQDTFYLEFRITLTGPEVWYAMQVYPFDEPSPRRVVVSFTDISRRTAAEQALQKANESLEQRVALRTAELHRITTRIETIFDSSSDGILLYDLKFGIEQANRAFKALFGFQDQEYISYPLTALCQPEDISIVDAALKRVIDGSSLEHVEVRALRAGRQPLEVEIGISPVRYRNLPSDQLVCTIRDISQRNQILHRIDEERNLLRTVIDAIPDFVYVKDTQHRLLLNNAAHAKSLKLTELLVPSQLTDQDFFPPEMAAKYHADEEQVLRTGQPLIGVEERSIGTDGNLIWALTTKVPLRNLDHEIIGLVGITYDISEQKRQQEILRQSRDQVQQAQMLLEEVLDTIPVRVFWKDQQCLYLGCNRLFALDAGLAGKEQIVGKSDHEMPWREHTTLYYADDIQVMQSGVPKLNYEEPIHTAKGDSMLIQSSKLPLRNARGEIIGVLGVYVDVTAQRQAELEARRHEADLHSILNSTTLAFVLLDHEGNIRTFNQIAQTQIQHQYGTLLAPGRKMVTCLPTTAQKRFQERLIRVLQGESFAVDEATWDGDKQHFWEFRYYPVRTLDGNIVGANLTFEDITARKEIEQQLLYNASLQETVSDAVIVTDMEYRIQSWNKAAERIYGWTAAEVMGKHAGQILAPQYESQQSALTIIQEMIDRGFWTGESKQRRRDDTWLHILGSLVLLRDGRGLPMGIISVNHDITDRKQAEIELRAVTQRLEVAALSGRIGIWEWDIKKDQVIWDERMSHIYGLEPRSILGTVDDFYNHLHPEDAPVCAAELDAACRGEKPFDTTFRIIRQDGEVRYVKANGTVLQDENGQPERMIGVNWDMTQIKQSEEALRRALEREKELSELKSRFVSTASHEFRTPLATILATAETLVAYRHRMNDSDIEQRLQKIRSQIAHLRSIMDEVLHLSRIQAGRTTITLTQNDFDAFCRGIIDEFESHPHTHQKIVYTCTPQPLIMRFDQNLMRHVVSNLISNALKYAPDRQEIYVEVQQEGEMVVLKVRDEGIGIPTQDILRLFEPFHRAANVGVIPGTGLGLPISKNAVELHGGTIEVESQIGQGSTFTVKLPIALSSVPPEVGS